MAEGVLETNDMEQIDLWLKRNKLKKAVGRLKENDVTLSELKELANESSVDELKVYAQEELQLDLVTAKRFAKAVVALSSRGKKSSKDTRVRIVISNEEHEAMNDIVKRREDIKLKMNMELSKVGKLNEVSKRNKKELDQFRKDMIYEFNQRMDELYLRAERMVNNKKEVIDKNIESLQNIDKLLAVADSQVNEMLDDVKMDMNKRKIKILNISKDVLKREVQATDINLNLILVLDRNGMVKFFNSFGGVDAGIDAGIDAVPQLSVSNIEQNCVTVHVNNNKKQQWQCIVELCANDGNDDEKTREQWKQKSTFKTDSHQIEQLIINTRYQLRARFKNDKDGYGKWCRAISFKTPLMDSFSINDAHFFEYKNSEYGRYFHIFGKNSIRRRHMKQYTWKIKTSALFQGRYGIIDDTKDASKKIVNGECICRDLNVVNIGSKHGGHDGGAFGIKKQQDLHKFIEKDDIVFITVNFESNTIAFISDVTQKQVQVPLRTGIDIVKFIAECNYVNSDIQLL